MKLFKLTAFLFFPYFCVSMLFKSLLKIKIQFKSRLDYIDISAYHCIYGHFFIHLFLLLYGHYFIHHLLLYTVINSSIYCSFLQSLIHPFISPLYGHFFIHLFLLYTVIFSSIYFSFIRSLFHPFISPLYSHFFIH